MTCRQFYAILYLRAESLNPAFSPQNLLRLYYNFEVKFLVDNQEYSKQIIEEDGFAVVPENPTKEDYREIFKKLDVLST